MDRDKTTFSKTLQIKMNEHNVNKATLARVLDISDTSVHRYINGTALPREFLLIKLAKFFGCSTKEFFIEK